MKIVEQSFEILTPIDRDYIYSTIEKAARTCYKSEDKIKEGSAEKLIKALVTHGHEAMLEHAYISVKLITDRAIANEIVRHRLCSFAQESTRYVNYKDGIEVIKPPTLTNEQEEFWRDAVACAESQYKHLIEHGVKPEIARAVLPLCTKTEIVVTADLREWKHIFNLRVIGITGMPHPQIRELLAPVLEEFAENLPIIFEDQYELMPL